MIAKRTGTLAVLCLALLAPLDLQPLRAQELSYSYFIYLPIVRSAPPLPPPLRDRLRNPGFEGLTQPGGYTHDTYNGIFYSEILTPEGWVSWWKEEPDPWYGFGRPEIRPIPNIPPYSDPPNRIHGGDYAALSFSFWKRQQAGFYQPVNDLPAGATATFSAYAHSWACNNDPPPALSCGDPNGFWFKVGIDPHGGTDPWASSVVWSAPFYYADIYGRVGPIQATVGEEGRITVFLFQEAKWGVKHNDAYWDDAELIVQPLPVDN